MDHYRFARSITHDYVRQVSAEGIQALMAVPVVVGRQTRGVIYGGLRRSASLGDTSASELVRVSRGVARELEIHDQVEIRLQELSQASLGAHSRNDPRISESITESYLHLHEIASATHDQGLKTRILEVEKKLRSLTSPSSPSAAMLTRRETQVLSYVALGCRNAEIAERLNLSTDTVKTYMRNLMSKLDVTTRHSAVVEARRQGLIP